MRALRHRFALCGLLSVLTVLACVRSAAAAPGPATAPAKSEAGELAVSDKIAVTTHQITIAGQPLRYTATAGYLPLKDEAGKARAQIFFIAYTKLPATATLPATTAPATQPATAPADPTRPITFILNGGPGAASVWLHLGAAGPYRIALPDTGEAPPPPYRLVENQSTWLAESDLVFIDPVGTGYSRATNLEQAKEFYNFREDINSLGEFIRLYVTRYQRWSSPAFVAGESYGGTRAAALAEHLLERVGLALNGVVLISPALSFQNFAPSETNELPYPLYLPTYTAAAFYHRKLAPDLLKDLDATLAEAQTFALTTYWTALAQGASLTPAPRREVIEKLARYTGLSPDYLDKADLRVDPSRFEKALLADDKPTPRIIGRFDARLTAYADDPLASAADFDPSLSAILPIYASTFNAYVRTDLHYENDLPYEVLKQLGFDLRTQSPYLYVGDNLRAALRRNPHLKVLLAAGRFDLAVPYAANSYAIAHLRLPAPLRGNVTQHFYLGGHMFYHQAAARQAFHADLAAFVREAVGGAGPRPDTAPRP